MLWTFNEDGYIRCTQWSYICGWWVFYVNPRRIAQFGFPTEVYT